MFRKDDIVVYGAPGVCRIVGIIQKTFAGSTHAYYELQPVYDEKSTVLFQSKTSPWWKKCIASFPLRISTP